MILKQCLFCPDFYNCHIKGEQSCNGNAPLSIYHKTFSQTNLVTNPYSHRWKTTRFAVFVLMKMQKLTKNLKKHTRLFSLYVTIVKIRAKQALFQDHFNMKQLIQTGNVNICWFNRQQKNFLERYARGFAPGFVTYKNRCTQLAAASDKVYQLLAHGRWFSSGSPASSTTKTGRHDTTRAPDMLMEACWIWHLPLSPLSYIGLYKTSKCYIYILLYTGIYIITNKKPHNK
jgi:hypothetical protein